MSCPVDQDVFTIVGSPETSLKLPLFLPDQIHEDCSAPRFFYFSTECEISMSKDKTVWSSEQGDLCKQKDKLPATKSLPPQQQTAYLHRESSGRGGKAVTLVKVVTQYTQTIGDGRVSYSLV